MTTQGAELQSLLRISERNNRRGDVTGCLMYSGQHFAQTLEGRMLVERIRTDPRHTDLRVFVDEEATERLCPDWSMGFLYNLDLVERLALLTSSADVSPEEARALMTRMWAGSMMGSL